MYGVVYVFVSVQCWLAQTMSALVMPDCQHVPVYFPSPVLLPFVQAPVVWLWLWLVGHGLIAVFALLLAKQYRFVHLRRSICKAFAWRC